ncbi:MAG: cytochrome C oxidase subunit IV family protein [Longimicrobiales bacterium]
MAAGEGGQAAHREPAAPHHPTWKFYVLIGVVLTVITAMEVAIFYIEALQAVLVPLLLVLSGAKFIMVVLFYMHLKFDSKVLSGVFAAPLLLGVLVVVSLIVLFNVLPLS